MVSYSYPYRGGLVLVAQNYGTRIKALRDALGLTQVELARRAGVRQPLISRWERGQGKRPGGPELAAIARVLGTTSEALLGELSEPAEPPAPRGLRREDLPEWARTAWDKIQEQSPRNRAVALKIFTEWWEEEQERQCQEAERERFRRQEEEERQREQGRHQTG